MREAIIVFEGGEGSGKSTVSRLVHQRLAEGGLDAIWTREPGGSPAAETIRALIFNEMSGANAETRFGLFWAARAEHIASTMLPALEKGRVVICDRFDGSTWSYQLYGQEQHQLLALFWEMRKHYLREVLTHLHYLYLDIESSLGVARAHARGGEVTHFDERELAFHERVREGYRNFWPQIAEPNETIDASLPLMVVAGTAHTHTLRWIQSNNAPA